MNRTGLFATDIPANRRVMCWRIFRRGGVSLDCGCGELTNTALLLFRLDGYASYSCFDLSWSRVFLGREFFRVHVPYSLLRNTNIFVADIADMPLPDNAIDIVTTSHALEEPITGANANCWRNFSGSTGSGWSCSSPPSNWVRKNRKTARNLPEIISAMGCDLVKAELMETYSNPLNRTAPYVVKKKMVPVPSNGSWSIRFQEWNWCGKGPFISRQRGAFSTPSSGRYRY